MKRHCEQRAAGAHAGVSTTEEEVNKGWQFAERQPRRAGEDPSASASIEGDTGLHVSVFFISNVRMKKSVYHLLLLQNAGTQLNYSAEDTTHSKCSSVIVIISH